MPVRLAHDLAIAGASLRIPSCVELARDMLGIRLYFLFNLLAMMLIQSIQFSSQIILASYPTFKGQVLNGKEVWDLMEGLAGNDLLYYTHLLTGMPYYTVP
ncbi:Pyridoxal kinase-like protein [Drosera capensis]